MNAMVASSSFSTRTPRCSCSGTDKIVYWVSRSTGSLGRPNYWSKTAPTHKLHSKIIVFFRSKTIDGFNISLRIREIKQARSSSRERQRLFKMTCLKTTRSTSALLVLSSYSCCQTRHLKKAFSSCHLEKVSSFSLTTMRSSQRPMAAFTLRKTLRSWARLLKSLWWTCSASQSKKVTAAIFTSSSLWTTSTCCLFRTPGKTRILTSWPSRLLSKITSDNSNLRWIFVF